MSKYRKKTTRNQNPQNAKSMKTSADDLKDMIKAAVNEALGEKDDDLGSDLDDSGIDIRSIIEDAVEAVAEKRKSRKEAGEEVDDDITPDEIIEEVTAILDEIDAEEGKASDGREEPTDSDDEGEEKDDDDEDEQKGKRKASRAPYGRQRKSRSATPQRKYAQNFYVNSGETGQKTEKKKASPHIMLARAVKCFDVFGRHDPDQAAYYAKKYYQDDEMARQFKALSATNPSSGGYLIPEVYLDEIIEMLYAKTVIFELGARKVPMANGNLNMPKMTSGARARWGGEQRKIAVTQPKYGNIKLSAKRLEAIVGQTRELMLSSNYSADEMFARDLTRRMELGLDYGGMFGTGGDFQPVGITKTDGILVLDSSKITDDSLVDTKGRITADFPVWVRSQVLAKNVDDLALGWTFNSMMEGYLMNLKTTTGAYIYREEMNLGKLLGFPYRVSNQINTDNNKTSMIFGNWADLIVGEQLGLETFTTLEGVWTDEDGIQHNAFEENLSGTRALMYVDIAVRHPESFAHVKNAVIA